MGLIYGANSIPTTYLIDREGHFLGGALGPRDWATDEAFELINHLLNISPVPWKVGGVMQSAQNLLIIVALREGLRP